MPATPIVLADELNEYRQESFHVDFEVLAPHGLDVLQRIFIPMNGAAPVHEQHGDVTVIGQHTKQGVVCVGVQRGFQRGFMTCKDLGVKINAQRCTSQQGAFKDRLDFAFGHAAESSAPATEPQPNPPPPMARCAKKKARYGDIAGSSYLVAWDVQQCTRQLWGLLRNARDFRKCSCLVAFVAAGYIVATRYKTQY